MTKGSNLVIVESPSKAKTIGKYLGPDYRVEACMGHLRDLPKSKMGVDLEHDFEPDYQPLASKAAIISELRSASKAAKHIYLATDPDREGEAISWHLKELLELPDDKTERVTFNEITKNVVTRSIQEPRGIDYNLVDAQQARRILDRIVGYQLSPLLWKKIRRGLSAGRVQSVATRLVVEREQEIEAFVPKEYWTIDVLLRCLNKPGSFTAHYYGEEKKRELHSEAEADEVLRDIAGQEFTIAGIKRTEKRRSPTPPFITSTLQQEASRKLNMTPRRTMAVAQQLYEGVDISGEGTVGLITYMRTDSLRLSEEALAAARDFITDRYGPAYYPGQPRHFRKKEGAQDAHEAIRPSNVRLDPESIQADLTREQYRLYKLIWSRFVACQMSDARYDAVQIDARCAGHAFRASDQILKILRLLPPCSEEGRDDEAEERSSSLPDLDGSERLTADKQEKAQHFTQPPARYTEATLIKALEENGIGRPSTYAPIITTIIDRDYVERDQKKLAPTTLGRVINELMLEQFPNIVDVKFSAHMEEELDTIENGKTDWHEVIDDFYTDFDKTLKEAEVKMEGKRIKVPDEETDEVCELCGRKMVIKTGRFGKFLACPGFPECKNTRKIVQDTGGVCPLCGGKVLAKKSKKGKAYYGCEHNPKCGFMTWDTPLKEVCPKCGATLFKKTGKMGRIYCAKEGCDYERGLKD